MSRQLAAICWASCLLAMLPAIAAGADEVPVRKPGLWEMKIVRTGMTLPELTMQHCTDEATDKEMNTGLAPAAKEACSKHDIKKTPTGYVSDSVCTIGGASITAHADIIGDFNSAYTVKTTSHTEHGPTALPRDATTTVEAKWLGACKPDQKPGDMVMPGGFKMNLKDAQKLQGVVK
jgi:hypothetical protein